jgi:MSHA biogenesis protein MshO
MTDLRLNHSSSYQRGFTLIELVMVIVVLGVMGSIVAVFMKGPIDAYFTTARRAGLSDVADTTVRRMARDIRKALPNSLRQSVSPNPVNSQCIEFIPTKTGGRYRSDFDASGSGNVLNFAATDTSFDMIGINSTLADQTIVVGDLIAVYNQGVPGADAYETGSPTTSAVTGLATGALSDETTISINSKQFPFESPNRRFHVIPKDEYMVAFVCSGGNLYRTASTSFTNSCPATGAILARNVSACNFVYNGSDLQRNALVQLSVTLTDNGESVSLYQEVHVDNTP